MMRFNDSLRNRQTEANIAFMTTVKWFHNELAFFRRNVRSVINAVCASRAAVFLVGAFAAYHAALLAWHHATPGSAAAVGMSAILGGTALLLYRAAKMSTHRRARVTAKAITTGLLLCWAGINGYYLADWITHVSFAQRDASRWLAANLPPDTILIGDVAPGLSLYNRFKAVSVIPGLCNDRDPIARFSGLPRAVVILDGRDKEHWWAVHYPDIVAPGRRMALFPNVGRFSVGVYRVPSEK